MRDLECLAQSLLSLEAHKPKRYRFVSTGQTHARFSGRGSLKDSALLHKKERERERESGRRIVLKFNMHAAEATGGNSAVYTRK